MKLGNCSHFYCHSCGIIRPVKEANQVTVAWPIFERGCEKKLIYNKGVYLLCDKCHQDGGKEHKEKGDDGEPKKAQASHP